MYESFNLLQVSKLLYYAYSLSEKKNHISSKTCRILKIKTISFSTAKTHLIQKSSPHVPTFTVIRTSKEQSSTEQSQDNQRSFEKHHVGTCVGKTSGYLHVSPPKECMWTAARSRSVNKKKSHRVRKKAFGDVNSRVQQILCAGRMLLRG